MITSPPRASPALLEEFPELVPALPFHALVTRPTPVEPLPELSGAQVFVKRDDLTSPNYGGNKARKFEFILGQGLARGCRELWTVGGLCSNHCTAAAIYGREAGLKVQLFFAPTPLDLEEEELLHVQAHLGAEQAPLYHPDSCARWLRPPPDVLIVPPGGSSTEGVFGYVDAGLELARQVRSGEVPEPDVLYIASASSGTVLGLCMGLRLGGLATKVMAVETVDRRWQLSRALLPTPARAHRLLQHASSRLREALPSLRAVQPTFDRRFESIPLGAADPRVKTAMALGHERCGLQLDAHFSGKAFAALLQDLDVGWLAGKTVLFWQTHGQVPPALLEKSRAAEIALPGPVARLLARERRR
jgi:D-cysteine desulfhydrase